MQPIKIGLLGLGTVGGGTVSVLTRNTDEITRRIGHRVEITMAAAKEYKADSIAGLDQIGMITEDPYSVVNNPDIQIIIELIGGYSPAKELVMKAIENGKHVITANKALIALHGNEIFQAAQKQGVTIAFEAAVAGGIPIIKAVREGLAANQIEWIAGIINGTGNFILTEMRDKGRDFEDVLKEAQSLGYAEADPTFDVEGIDAAHKLTILSSIAFGIPLQFESTYTEGISKIEHKDILYAEELGYRIKHIGISRKVKSGIEQRVHPTLIPERRLIANVDGVMNAVLVKSDAVGPTLYYGAGAGAEPTASAVIADVVDVVRLLKVDPKDRTPHLGFHPDVLSDINILPIEEIETAYYLRMHAVDKPGVVADITKIFGDSNISIEAILQKEPANNESFIPVIFLTQCIKEKEMNKAISKVEQLDAISGKVMRIRMETFS